MPAFAQTECDDTLVQQHGITPQTIIKPIDADLVAVAEGDYVTIPLEEDSPVESIPPERPITTSRKPFFST